MHYIMLSIYMYVLSIYIFLHMYAHFFSCPLFLLWEADIFSEVPVTLYRCAESGLRVVAAQAGTSCFINMLRVNRHNLSTILMILFIYPDTWYVTMYELSQDDCKSSIFVFFSGRIVWSEILLCFLGRLDTDFYRSFLSWSSVEFMAGEVANCSWLLCIAHRPWAQSRMYRVSKLICIASWDLLRLS